MDHKSFETNMIDHVNRHSKEEEVNRGEALREKMETAAHRRRKKVTKAVIEYILWVVALVGIVALSLAYQIKFVHTGLAIGFSSLFAFIAGARINTLSIRIAKYGGK